MKVNRLADGVFSRIVGDKREISAYDRFMNLEKDIETNPRTTPYLKVYKDMVTRHKAKIKKMADTEELIMLHRIRSNRSIQLSVQREYVYARQFCPRNDTRNQDIRICIANTEFHDITDLENNPVLMDIADKKVCKALDEIIAEREKDYVLQYSKK